MDANKIATYAARQYYSRPDDQKYGSLEDLASAARLDKQNAAQATVRTADLAVRPAGPEGIHLIGQTGTAARLSPWAFGQLCTYLQTPRDYIRRQSPELMAECLTADLARAAHLSRSAGDEDAMRPDHRLLIRTFDSADDLPIVRAITSTKYRRVWDADLLQIIESARERRPALDLPPVWGSGGFGTNDGRKGGAYRSDRDMFVLLTDGGSIVTDPSAMRNDGDGRMFRGIMIKNSETGSASVGITAFWLRWICGNHLIHGAETRLDFNRRHIGRRFETEIAAALYRVSAWLTQPESVDRAIIDKALTTELGHDKISTIESLARTLKIPTSTAGAAYDLADQYEQNPRSIWGLANGLTRYSQSASHFADRTDLDQLAGRLLSRVKVAAA